MADTPIGGTSYPPGRGPNLTIGQGAARLAPVGTPSATPRPPARDPGNQPRQERTIALANPQDDFRDDRNYQPARNGGNGFADENDGPDILDDPSEYRGEDDGGIPDAEPVELHPETVLFNAEDGSPVTVQEARSGYLRQQDYSRKMQLVAQGRHVLEQQLGEVHSDREAVAGLIIQALPDLTPQNVQRMGWDANTISSLIGQRDQMLQFVQGLRQRSQEERQRIEQAEIQQGHALLPEVLPAWIDPQTAQRDQATTRKYLERIGVPSNVQAQIGKSPWLVRLAVEAAKFRSVQMGGERGRQVQAQQRGYVNPSLPAGNQGPSGPQTRQMRDVEQLRQQARGGRGTRDRMQAGVELLRGVPVRQMRR